MDKSASCILWADDHHIVLAKRIGGKYADYWENPGGKIKPKELIINGLVRELKEETGLFFLASTLHLLDCIVYEEVKKHFLFCTRIHMFTFYRMRNPEPHKRTNWQLVNIDKLDKMQLMRGIKDNLDFRPQLM